MTDYIQFRITPDFEAEITPASRALLDGMTTIEALDILGDVIGQATHYYNGAFEQLRHEFAEARGK